MLMTFKQRRKHLFLQDEQGQSIIETAFLLTLILLLVMVFISLAYGYYYRSNIHHLSANIVNILSLSDIQQDASSTTQRIEDILDFYESEIAFPIQTHNVDRFVLSWGETLEDLHYTLYTVRVEYRGPRIPFIEPIEISVNATSLKIER